MSKPATSAPDVQARAPFEQLAFADLPERPRAPHAYFDVPSEDVTLHTSSFGRVRVHYRVLGNAAERPPLLLVHGLMTSSYSWRYVIPALAESFTVVAPDLPGSGRSEMVDRSYHPDRYAEFLGEFLGALDMRGAAVIGNSLGGYLAMRLALQDSGAMSRLVNLHSPGVPLPRLYALRAALSLPGSERLLAQLVSVDPERWVHKNVHYYDETLKSHEETREYAAPLRTEAGRHAFYRILKETLDVRQMRAFERTLKERCGRGQGFPVPLQLIYAQADPMVPPEVGQRMRALVPGATFVELREASHFAHVDAAPAFLAAALPFLRSP